MNNNLTLNLDIDFSSFRLHEIFQHGIKLHYPEKDIPAKPDVNPDPTKPKPGGNEPEKNDPTRIQEPPQPAQPERIDNPPPATPQVPTKEQILY